MKRIVAFITMVNVVLTCFSGIGYAADDKKSSVVSEEYSGIEILMEDNFDDESEVKAEKTSGIEIVKFDDEHQKVAKLNQNNGIQNIGRCFESVFDDGVYGFSFDIYMEGVTGFEDIQILKGDAQDVLGSASTAMRIEYDGTERVMYPLRESAWYHDYETRKKIENYKWYNIEVWYDGIRREVRILLDGEEFMQLKAPEVLKDFRGFIIKHMPDSRGNEEVYVDNLKMFRQFDVADKGFFPLHAVYGVNEDIIGNNFFIDKMPKFDLTYTDRFNKSGSYKVKYEAISSDNNLFWEKESQITLNDEGNASETIMIDKKYFGVHTLNIIISDGERKYTKKIPFTLSNRNTNEPINYRSGVAGHIDRGRGEIDYIAPLLNYAGIGNLRGEDFIWSEIETVPGVYNFTESHEHYLDTLDKWDIDYLHLYSTGNSLYSNGISSGYHMMNDEAGYKALEKYMAELMKFADGRIKYVEVYNEYHNSHMSGDWHSDPSKLVDGTKAVLKGVKSVNPDVMVVGIDEDSWGFYQTGMIPKYLEYGKGQKWFDGVSLHPYAVAGKHWKNQKGEQYVKDVKAALAEYGYGKDVPMFFTEIGWSDYLVNFDMEQKAGFSVGSQITAFAENYAKVYYNYNTIDYPDVLPYGSSEATFGLLKAFSPAATEVPYLGKEAYVAIAYYNHLLANAKVTGKASNLNEDEFFAYMFEDRNNKNILTLGYLGDGEKNVGIRLDCERIIVGDIYGNESVIYGVDGVFNLKAKRNSLNYLIGDFKTAEFCEPVITMDLTALNLPVRGTNTLKINTPFGEECEISTDVNGCLEKIEPRAYKDYAEIEAFGLASEKAGKALVNIKKDGRLYYIVYIDIGYSTSGEISNFSISDVGGRSDLWMASLDITNIRTDKAISGVMNIPEYDMRIELPVINPQETRRIMIPIPKIADIKDLTTFKAQVEYTSGDSKEINESFNYIFADYTEKPPVIDGKLDEWSGNKNVYFLDEEQQVVMLMSESTWDKTQDLSGKFYFDYDEEFAYIAADITDDVFYQVNNYDAMWQGDSLQIAFGFDYSSANGTQYGVGLCPDGKSYMYRNAWEGDIGGWGGEAAQGLYTEGESAILRDGNHTYYEIKIPWNKIKADGGKVYKGKQLYFSFLINDNDGKGRKLYMQYGGGIGSGGNTIKHFYRLQLSSR